MKVYTICITQIMYWWNFIAAMIFLINFELVFVSVFTNYQVRWKTEKKKSFHVETQFPTRTALISI